MTNNVKKSRESGQLPTIGGGVLVSNGLRGWDPATLLFTTPLVLLRHGGGVSRLYAAGADRPFFEAREPALILLEDVLRRLKEQVPAAGPKAGKPAFPVALVAAAYEFGRAFAPHYEAFPHAGALEDDEFFAAIFLDAFKPDLQGGTERIGYAGTIPEGWMPGGPALTTSPYGHEAPPIIPHPTPAGVQPAPLAPTMTYEEYAGRIARIHEYLAAGDIYQANLTVPLRGRTSLSPEALFDASLQQGGAPYGGMFLLPGGTLVSFSPELLLRRRGADIMTRPIKGTRAVPRHMGGVAEATEALKSSEKDRAEHIMIVDLERNDLGRLCRPGTIKAKPLMKIIETPTVLHMETTVRGELRPGVTVHDLFAAVFPGGSVTGAPKKRALEILGGLEIGPRGIYCGAFGWIDSAGDCDLNLPIRTAILRPDGRIDYQAGGGIVADSDSREEWEEIEAKTRLLREALSAAGEIAP